MSEARALPANGYLSRMWQMRYFLRSLVRLDLETRYRHSFLGIGWSLIRPVAMSIVFCAIFCRLFKLPVSDYAPFVMTGLSIWQFLTEACICGCDSFNRGAAYIRQKPLPLALFPLRTVLGCGIHGSIALVLACVIAVVLKGVFNPWAMLALIPTLALVFLLALFLATLFGMIHVHFPDTQHLLEISLQIIFYLTPIMYFPSLMQQRSARAAALVELNPFAHVLDVIRQPIWMGEIAPLNSYLWTIGFCAVTGVIAIWCLKKLERTLVFWI